MTSNQKGPGPNHNSDCDDSRKCGRRHPHIIVKITDVSRPSIAGVLTDLSESGFGAYDLESVTGESRSFLVEPTEKEDCLPFTLEAVCRWTRKGPNGRGLISGFEITAISDQEKRELKKLITLFTADLDCCQQDR